MIPTYNQEKYISNAIRSALAIGYDNLQVIVNDDCSTDNTFEIANSIIDSRLEVYRNIKNLGRVGNYKYILENLAKGEWVINCDGDDFLLNSDFYSKAMEIAKNNESIVLFTANRFKQTFIGEKRIPQNIERSENLHQGNKIFLDFYNINHPLFHITSLYKRETAIKCNFYTQDITSSDMESLLRLLVNNNTYHINKSIAVWREHENNESKNIDYRKRISNLRIIESVYNFCINGNLIDKKTLQVWRKRFYLKRLRRTANLFLINNDYKSFFKFIRSTFKLVPKITIYTIFNYRVLLRFFFPFKIN